MFQTVDYSLDNGDNFATYYYLRNAQNDVVKLIDNSGTTVVEYTYDSWGKIISATGTLANTVGADQPFRYRGYVYDAETGWYYLRSRYYDPTTCRFINADVLLSTGQGIIGHNSFAYCLNNPINGLDSDGHALRPFNALMVDDGGSGPRTILYDVPIYGKNGYSLCWAFCQIMIESYHSGMTLSQSEATEKAIALAKSFCPIRNRCCSDARVIEPAAKIWNTGQWPTNVLPDGGSDVQVNTIESLYELLVENGPVYAYYNNTANGRAHMVVVIGVNLSTNSVYTINPQGVGSSGVQTFECFRQQYYGAQLQYDKQYCLIPIV